MEAALNHAMPLASEPLRKPPRTLCIVLAHHGYRGKPTDFQYLCSVCRQTLKDFRKSTPKVNGEALLSRRPRFVFIRPRENNGAKMDAGVFACARRYVDQVCLTVDKLVAKRLGIGGEMSCVAVQTTGVTADGAKTAAKHKLCFSAVGHSMGGLILRAALPELMERIEERFEAFEEVCEVHWDLFCTMATPHLGVRYMKSKAMTFLCRRIGTHLWPAMADLFCTNSVVGVDLTSDDYLAAWGRFERRVLLNVVNDNTVLTYSSSFAVTLDVLKRVGAPLPSTDEEITDMCCPQDDEEEEEEEEENHQHSDGAVLQLARLGVKCASSREELCDNGFVLESISPELWPPDVLVEERELAERILTHVGPLELHLVDFRPPCARLTSAAAPDETDGCDAPRRPGILAREMVTIAAARFGHWALVGKKPCKYPSVFGFVSEYIVKDLLLRSYGISAPVLAPQDGHLHCGGASNGGDTEGKDHDCMLTVAEPSGAPAPLANV